MDEKTYQILRIMQMKGVNCYYTSLKFYVVKHTKIFSGEGEVTDNLGWMEDAGLIVKDENKEIYSITEQARKPYKKYEKQVANTGKTQAREQWQKRNWVIADIIKISIGLVLGFILLCSPK